MQTELFSDLADRISQMDVAVPIGEVIATDGNKLSVSGLEYVAGLGDQVEVEVDAKTPVEGEVVQIDREAITVLPDGPVSGVTLGTTVLLRQRLGIAPHDSWQGRIIDANARPLDGSSLISGPKVRALTAPPPQAAKRKAFGPRLRTGSFALNTFLPLARGQRIGLFAGSGVGKTTLMGTLVQHVDCDVAVVALVGERGRELRHFIQTVLGDEGMKRCVIVAATSDQSSLERRRCALTAMAIAEHFRDEGKSVLYIADSITRFAEAHREIAATAGEAPVLRGHPPSTAQLITELCERAGPGEEGSGDITAVFTVLVQGSDMDEPIADILRGVLDGHIVLDRAIAERGRYPAINLLQSISRCLPDAVSNEENQTIQRVRHLTSVFEQNEMMIKSGLYAQGSDPETDLAIKVWHDIDNFLGHCGEDTPEQGFAKIQLILRRAGVL